MAEALYRKYRPTTFDDVVGQEHIERTLKNALDQQKVSHAYLFCGPRGTGKTTMARILAKAMLCEKALTTEPDGTCEECEAIAAGTHPDVYELDAASRTGVENVREEIINRVQYAPTRGSYKVYIIDEVHMLSTAAFNALLKTLEEPPEHVVFVLCTTDPQKVPDTILSRCQRFDFHRLSVDEIVAHLGAVCVQEDVEFEPEALELIAHQAEGGMRNALTSLEQLAAFGEGRVTLDGAHRILGSLDNEGLFDIVSALGRRDAGACFTWVSRYVETGADIAQFVQELAGHFRNLYLLSLADADVEIAVSSSTRASMESELEWFGPERLSRALGVLGDLMKELRATTNSRLAFEIALTRLLRPESDLTMGSLAERLEELEMKILSMPAQPFAPPAIQHAAVQMPSTQGVVLQQMPQTAPQMASVRDTSAQHPPVASVPLSTPEPQPAPQRVPAPAPQTAPQAMPQPAPVPAQPASQQTPTQQAAPVGPQSTSSAAQVSTASSPAAAPASFDFANASALQRMWRQVTTTLRNSNPARGVLFMGAKIEPDARGTGVRIVFSPDSSFAYAAAQKKEVRDLLSQTFVDVLGGSVAFELFMPQGQAQAPAASASPVSTATPQTPPAAPTQAAVQPAPARSTPVYEDESPFIDDDAAGSYDATPMGVNDSTPPTENLPEPLRSAAAAQVPSDAQASQAVPQASSATAEVGAPTQPAAPVTSAATGASEGDSSEADRIKEMLTASFGDGVKFDTM